MRHPPWYDLFCRGLACFKWLEHEAKRQPKVANGQDRMANDRMAKTPDRPSARTGLEVLVPAANVQVLATVPATRGWPELGLVTGTRFAWPEHLYQ